MSEEVCEITELPTGWCAHCKGIKSAEEEAVEEDKEFENQWLR